MSDENEENKKQLSKRTREVLLSLTPRELRVLRKRFGFDLTASSDLPDVENQFKITEERIHQIERKALTKLRKQTTENPSQTTLERCSFCKTDLARSDNYVESDSGALLCSACIDLCKKLLDDEGTESE